MHPDFPIHDSKVADFLKSPGESTFDPVFDLLQPRLYRYFYSRGMKAECAAELSNDVLWSVFRNVGTLRCQEAFYAWMFRIARNALLQSRRKQLRESLTHSSLQSLKVISAPTFEPPLQHWMQSLDGQERKLCVLRYVDDLDYRAISHTLRIPLGTVKWKLHQLKNKIALSTSPVPSPDRKG